MHNFDGLNSKPEEKKTVICLAAGRLEDNV